MVDIFSERRSTFKFDVFQAFHLFEVGPITHLQSVFHLGAQPERAQPEPTTFIFVSHQYTSRISSGANIFFRL